MQLSAEEVRRFYGIWLPLLSFVNEQRQVVSAKGPWHDRNQLAIEDLRKLRTVLWADNALLQEFIAANPATLAPEDLAIAATWTQRVQGHFFVVKHLKKHSALQAGDGTFYGVVGLVSPLAQLVPHLPHLVEFVLLPWEDRITYDSLLVGQNIFFGRNIRGRLNREYQEARRDRAIVTSLSSRFAVAAAN